MAHPKSTRDKLRRLYVVEHLSLESAAQLCEISFGTARRWRDEANAVGDDWGKIRAAHTLASGSLEEIARAMLAETLVQYQSTMALLKEPEQKELHPATRAQLLASLADSFAKAVAANRRVLPETNRLAIALEVLEKQLVFVQQNFPQHLEAFVQVAEPFAVEVERYFAQTK